MFKFCLLSANNEARSITIFAWKHCLAKNNNFVIRPDLKPYSKGYKVLESQKCYGTLWLF